DLGGTGPLLERAAVDKLGEGVVRCLPGGAECGGLDEARQLGQFRVPAAVVEVQVRVGGQPQVSDADPDGRQGLLQFCPAGPVVGVDLRVGAHSGVDQ